MQITNATLSENTATITVGKTSSSMMNALRRTILNEVPILAIHTIDFRTQTSALYDEMLAHRIGLNPITTDYDTYDYEDVEDENARSAKSKVTMTLSLKGPGMVLGEHLKSKDPSVKSVYNKMPLVKLDEDQELAFEAIAIMGKGKDHAKWSPGIASYYHEPIINVLNNSPEKSVRDKYPASIFNGTKIDESKIVGPEIIDAIEGVDDSVITIERKEDSYIFTAESFGMISAKEMIARGAVELTRMLEDFQKEVKRAL